MDDEEDLDALLDRIPAVAGRPRTVTELAGGLTNQNLRVTSSGGGDHVVRRFRGDAELLGIDRDAEHHNTVAAAEAGVGPAVVDYRPDLGVMLIEYVDGVTYDNDSFTEPGAVERVGRALRRLHAGPRFSGDFDMVARQAGYLRVVHEQGYRLFDGYEQHDEAFRRAGSSLAPDISPSS